MEDQERGSTQVGDSSDLKEPIVPGSIDMSDIDLDEIGSRIKLDKKNYLGWMSYDIANTFYASGILTLMALSWILIRGQQDGLTYNQSNFLFNATLSGASVFMAVMLPILGSLSDVLNERKRFVLVFSGISIFSTFLFSISTNIYLILGFFAVSMIFYQWAQVFYDAMLPGVVPPGQEARLSSLAIAIGYIGGAFVIVYAALLASNEPNARLEDGPLSLGYFPSLIALILIGFVVFMIPMFFVKETDWHAISATVVGDQIELEDERSLSAIIKSSFGELGDTFRGIYHNNRGMFFYIIAYFIIADFANLIVLINTTYLRDGLGLAEDFVLYATIVTGASIVLFSYFIGVIADRKGAKRSYQVIGVMWMVALALLIMVDVILPRWIIFVAAAIVGPAFSGVWISQRQMVLELVPTEQEVGRYFGLTKFSGKISSALGPIIWASLFAFGAVTLDFETPNAFRFALIGFALILLVGFLPDFTRGLSDPAFLCSQ
ncbi:MAG: MFS transporter [Candidatus Kariarchaeaceae archaeon]